MGFFSGIRRRIKKIIPKEIRPALPFIAAGFSGPLGAKLGLGSLSALQQKAILAGGTKFLSDDEANVKDVLRTSAIAAAPAALDAGIQGLDSSKGLGKFLTTAGKGKDATSIAEKVSRFADPSGLDALTTVGAQAATDFGIKQAELNEKALEQYNADLLARGIRDKAERRSAIFNIFTGAGYDILRIQGTKASIKIDNEDFEGTGYFQKVSVQAPTSPWFWGMLHFDDGSYLDWFMPHLSFSCLNLDDKPWKLRDIFRNPKIGSGIFHDANRDKTEEFKNCEVELIEPVNEEILTDNDGNKLPKFRVRLWNETTKISLEVRAASRAKWTFDQPTRAGMVSHLTYNEYPLELLRISISDEQGLRTKNDYSWIHGNAEHSWGLLH